ncbi:MAG: hypothetical protein ABIT38_24595 [Gemmatimonadaceae bacterium]
MTTVVQLREALLRPSGRSFGHPAIARGDVREWGDDGRESCGDIVRRSMREDVTSRLAAAAGITS